MPPNSAFEFQKHTKNNLTKKWHFNGNHALIQCIERSKCMHTYFKCIPILILIFFSLVLLLPILLPKLSKHIKFCLWLPLPRVHLSHRTAPFHNLRYVYVYTILYTFGIYSSLGSLQLLLMDNERERCEKQRRRAFSNRR